MNLQEQLRASPPQHRKPAPEREFFVAVLISRRDYELFRNSMKGEVLMPASHDEWLAARNSEEEMIRASGDGIDYVAAHHGEFLNYCSCNKSPPSYAMLMAYAVQAMRLRRESRDPRRS